ncbi:Fe-S cluster assembly protein SufB [Candidatus Amesbacteria bacterium RIFOXYB1_FULL_44_23]|uniref:Fe-S cluster assembly protein SufB n=1 Tax=Candidatus Amesbacteria bacterium RIFOXYB1_FULL_44_23 TaxID=1797263 RepID=A0A1F4ZPY0_9BACT|nr:MAG: Fe-S cluster assembly protein SufB [Candidatus Amesbacteria bacterium RIFOXYB1_FULL_44_23]
MKNIKTNYKYGFSKPETETFRTPKGLDKKIVEAISGYKKEPEWMRDFRFKSLEIFKQKAMPGWGADLSGINFDDLYYYINPSEKKFRDWKDVPTDIKDTYEKIGIPQAERLFLAGVGAQYDSEMIYHSLKTQWEKQGVIFLGTDTALQKYPEVFKQYFGKVVPPDDNKFAALNSAVWSGGSFVYVPAGVQVTIPLQAYFRINAANMGQFERTLIIAEEGSFVHYVEGCTAPIYTTDSLHSAVVEIVVKRGARVRYTTIQNWSSNVYNLVTKRMLVEEEGVGEWIDGNLGSKKTMKYPSVVLQGKGAKGEILSLAMAGAGQHQDAGGKAIHLAPYTTSTITSKSISMGGGRSSYRGLVKIINGAKGSKSFVRCDALLLDDLSRSDTYPTNIVREQNVTLGHEATVSRVGEEQLFYLMSRGLSETQATSLIVNGFIEPIVKELPLEYAVELNRLINMSMEGSVG